MRIGLAFTDKISMREEIRFRNLNLSDDALEEYDTLETVEAVEAAIQANGHEVIRLGWGNQMVRMLTTLVGLPFRAGAPDLVFNIAEGFGGRCREAQVPAFLDMMGIPYVGSDALTLAATLDKDVTKTLVRAARVVTPRGVVSNQLSHRDLEDLRSVLGLNFPFIVKPLHEGSSRGVKKDSVVRDNRQLLTKVAEIENDYQEPALVEEFIQGTEVTVGVVGYPAKMLGAMELSPKQDAGWEVYSLEVKRDFFNVVDVHCPPRLPADVLQRIERDTLTAFKVLGCRDFARIDFRVTSDGIPVLIEANPLPGLNPGSDLPLLAKGNGVSYQGLIGRILDSALARLGLDLTKSGKMDRKQ